MRSLYLESYNHQGHYRWWCAFMRVGASCVTGAVPQTELRCSCIVPTRLCAVPARLLHLSALFLRSSEPH